MAQLPLDVCIRGAGVVGRTLALLLARERLRVGLVAAPAASTPLPGTAEPQTDVRAYALNRASRDVLESLRAWPEAPACTPVLGMEVQGDDGGLLHFDAAAQGTEALAWIVDLPPLLARLAEALRYQPLVEMLDAPRPAALTVVCEGRASATRAEFGVGFDTTPYAQRAIAARLHCEKPHGGLARQWFLPDGVLALLPMAGPQGDRAALVWSADAAKAPELMALDDAAFAQAVQAATGDALGALTLTAPRADWPLQFSRADRWTGPMPAAPAAAPAASAMPAKGPTRTWALAGDAAHTVHPLAGQGLNLGLADAAELASVLHQRDYWRSPGDARLLRRYERARKAALWPMGLATDGLQQVFSLPGKPWQALRNWGMRGFDASGPVKSWVARQAMGAR